MNPAGLIVYRYRSSAAIGLRFGKFSEISLETVPEICKQFLSESFRNIFVYRRRLWPNDENAGVSNKEI